MLQNQYLYRLYVTKVLNVMTIEQYTALQAVMVFIWGERSGRSRPPLQKCRKAAPPKKCRKEGRLKICSKCSPPQKCCEAALQKVPCYV